MRRMRSTCAKAERLVDSLVTRCISVRQRLLRDITETLLYHKMDINSNSQISTFVRLLCHVWDDVLSPSYWSCNMQLLIGSAECKRRTLVAVQGLWASGPVRLKVDFSLHSLKLHQSVFSVGLRLETLP